jgi:hypothetical protein
MWFGVRSTTQHRTLNVGNSKEGDEYAYPAPSTLLLCAGRLIVRGPRRQAEKSVGRVRARRGAASALPLQASWRLLRGVSTAGAGNSPHAMARHRLSSFLATETDGMVGHTHSKAKLILLPMPEEWRTRLDAFSRRSADPTNDPDQRPWYRRSLAARDGLRRDGVASSLDRIQPEPKRGMRVA